MASVMITPLVKKLAIRIGAVDKPNERKVHTKLMARLGGLAIFLSFMIGFVLFLPNTISTWPIVLGATIIVITGVIDDMKELSAKAKMGGQILAALVTVLGGLQIEFITIPGGNVIEFGVLAAPLTMLWIVAIINGINFLDGLDGLAAGVSSIVLLTFSVLGILMGSPIVALLGFLLLGSTLGFLIYNFHPAKIFMGDTGSMFLGYMISVLAVLGLFKNVAIFSLAVPIIILGVPILDTSVAIVRRIINKKPLGAPDKYHLHHRLLNLGFSHRQTVVLIYAMSAMFSVAAIMFTEATLWGSGLILLSVIILAELVIEMTGLISENYRPLLRLLGAGKHQQQRK